MADSIPLEIFHAILLFLIDDFNLGDDLDERVSPFHTDLPFHPSGRHDLATGCSLVSKRFYDLAMPLLWRSLAIRRPSDLQLLSQLSASGLPRPTRRSLPEYTRRVDFFSWVDQGSGVEDAIRLLSGMSELRVLTLADYRIGVTMWSDRSSGRFLRSIPTACPRLQRLQFMTPNVTPTLAQVALLSVGCRQLKTFQTVCVNTGELNGMPDEEGQNVANLQEKKGDTLVFGFSSLKTLSIGNGFLFVALERSANTEVLLEALLHRQTPMPQLQELHSYIPTSGMHRIPGCSEDGFFKEHLRCSVHYLGGRHDSVPRYATFRNLRCLIVVLSFFDAPVMPPGLEGLQTIEFVTRRRPWRYCPDDLDAAKWDQALLQSMEVLLRGLVLNRSLHPSLTSVILWTKVPGNRLIIDELIRDFTPRFQRLRIALERKVQQRAGRWGARVLLDY